MKFRYYCILLFFIACQSNSKHAMQDLLGQWQAYTFLEEGDTVDISPSEVSLDFRQNGIYYFTSTLNFKEAGHYKIENNLLYTIDTLTIDPIEKAVQIEYLSPDTLILLMNKEGVQQTLKLKRF